MSTPTPARKLATIFKSVLIAGVFVFCGIKVVLIGGTKANGTFSSIATRPPTAPSVTTTKTATTATKTAPASERSP
jgi:hypothetical protein